MFQVGQYGSRFDSNTYFPTHRSLQFKCVWGPHCSTKPLPHCHCWRESRIPAPPGSVSTKGQPRAQKDPSCRGEPGALHGRTRDGSIAGDLWVLLFADIKRCGAGAGEQVQQKNSWHGTWHISVRSDTGGIVAPQREAAAKPSAVPDLRQRLLLVIQHQEAQGSWSSMNGSRPHWEAETSGNCHSGNQNQISIECSTALALLLLGGN